MGVYWVIAQHSQWPWMTMLGFIAAPFLLLRSPQSVSRGMEMLRSYVSDSNGVGILIGWIALVVFNSVSFILIHGVFIEYGPFAFIVLSIIVFPSMPFFFSFTKFRRLECYVAYFAILMFAGLYLYLYYGYGLLTMYSIFILLSYVLFVLAVRFDYISDIDLIIFSIFTVLGLFCRCVVMRMIATVTNIGCGLQAFFSNFRDLLLCKDIFLQPEIMPGAGAVDKRLSWRGFVWRARSFNGISDYIFASFLSIVIYFPALLYRFNIKASFWLWWPLTVALHRPQWMGATALEERMRTRIAVWSKLVLALFWPTLLVLILWLAASHFPQNLRDTVDAWMKVVDVLPPPPSGAQRVILWGIAVLALIVWFFAFAIRAAHAKALEGAKDFSSYDNPHKQSFMVMAERFHLSLRLLMALVALSAWLYFLWWALRWPWFRVFVWDWLRPWLSPEAIANVPSGG